MKGTEMMMASFGGIFSGSKNPDDKKQEKKLSPMEMISKVMEFAQKLDPEKLKAEWMPKIQQLDAIVTDFYQRQIRIENNQAHIIALLEKLTNGNSNGCSDGNPASGSNSDSSADRNPNRSDASGSSSADSGS